MLPLSSPPRLTRPSPLLALLRHAAGRSKALSFAAFPSHAVRRAVTTGLGPLLFSAVENDPHARQSADWSLLQRVSLTERVLAADRVEALQALLGACTSRLHTPLTVLKGISISEQHYPAAHLRPMRDLDILVAPEEIHVIESVLATLGYQADSTRPPTYYRHHHHIAPFYHPHLQLWVEVHHALFPSHRRSGQEPLFARAHVATQLRPHVLHGQLVNRLSDELQLLYTIVHWADHCEPDSGVLALLDVIYLLKNTAPTLAWEQIVSWLSGSHITPAVYLVLSYLVARNLIALPPHVLAHIAIKQESLGRGGRALLHFFIDRYFVQGVPFGSWWTARNVEIVWRTLLSAQPWWRNALQTPRHLLFDRRQIFYDLQ